MLATKAVNQLMKLMAPTELPPVEIVNSLGWEIPAREAIDTQRTVPTNEAVTYQKLTTGITSDIVGHIRIKLDGREFTLVVRITDEQKPDVTALETQLKKFIKDAYLRTSPRR